MSRKRNKVKQIQRAVAEKKAAYKESYNAQFETGLRRDKTLSLGVVLNQLGDDQISNVIITQINNFISQNLGLDVICYYEVPGLPKVSPLFGVMHSIEAFGHLGPLLCVSIKNVPTLLSSYSQYNKYFYVIADEWVGLSLEEATELYGNKELTLIAASVEVQKLLKDGLGVEVKHVVPNFDMKELVRIIGQENYYKEDPYDYSLK